MNTASDTVASLVERVHDAADAFATSADPLFIALDAGRPVEASTMVPPIRTSIEGMRQVLAEMENILDTMEK